MDRLPSPSHLVTLSSSEVPPPVLFSTWKHHAGAIRQHIAVTIQSGAPGLDRLPESLRVIGTDLMDLYTGSISPAEIGEQIVSELCASGHLLPDVYRHWLQEAGGFRLLTLAGDNSRWVLQGGAEEGRYVHIHPGRGSPQTRRVRANVLKTAIMVLAHIGIHGGDPLDVTLINLVRQRLGLAPIGRLTAERGLSEVIRFMNSP
jgi:hypothetical protein